MDIGEGVAGQVAELSAVHQVLQQRLSEEFSRTSPQSLAFMGTMSAPCRPVTRKSKNPVTFPITVYSIKE